MSVKSLLRLNRRFAPVSHPFNEEAAGGKTYGEWEFKRGGAALSCYAPRFQPEDILFGKDVLDVGCGEGGKSLYFLSLGAKSVTGIDIVPEYGKKSRALAEKLGLSDGFEYVCGDATNLPFDNGSFDVVIARNLMWNLPHPETAYAEWLRVLAPKGILLNYDAEYAKDHHRQKLPALNAHADVSAELLNECHNIYHMLEISLFERPRWDLEILKALGSCSCSVDQSVGDRIYAEQDIFYIPVPMFCIKAVKN